MQLMRPSLDTFKDQLISILHGIWVSARLMREKWLIQVIIAKFEVCGHRFADLSEYGYGVALLNDW
jgi:hypothetical protein